MASSRLAFYFSHWHPRSTYAGAGPDLSGPNVVVKVSAVSWQQGPGIWTEGDAGHAG